MNLEATYDLTLPITSKMPVFPGDPAPELFTVSDIRKGDPLTISHISMGCHVGTHVDCPAHFLEDGPVLGAMQWRSFMGQARVLELTGSSFISREDLAQYEIPRDYHILLKTTNSARLAQSSFTEDYVFMDPEAANYLAGHNPRSVGFDYYSLDPASSQTFPAHTRLAEQGIPVFVCLDLSGPPSGDYWFVGLPLRLDQLEGAPARVLLQK